MKIRGWVTLRSTALALTCIVVAPGMAEEVVFDRLMDPEVGECVVFREGGGGFILKEPTYWLRGSISSVFYVKKLAGRCPVIGKQSSAFTAEDWIRFATAIPCVEKGEDVREVQVLRVAVTVDEWETPWSSRHGTAGWLFRGRFLGQTLTRGASVEMNADSLERCHGG